MSRYQGSGGSAYKSSRRAPPPPPTGPNSFIFTCVFTEKCLCRRLAPPPMRVGAPPPPPTGNPGSAPAGDSLANILSNFKTLADTLDNVLNESR